MGAENIDLTEVKQAVDAIGTAWEEFQKTNEERLKQIEEKGSADPLTEDKLAKINETLAGHEAANQKLTKAIEEQKAAAEKTAEDAEKAAEAKEAATKEQMDRIETALNRTDRGGLSEEETEAKEANAAYFSYLRRGEKSLSPDEVKVLTIADDTQAGYLAPPEYVLELIKAEIVFSPIRTIARVRQTGRTSMRIPRRSGTFAAQWVGESGSRDETTGLKYALEELPTHELYALVDISNAMLEDSVFDLEGELSTEFAEQFGVAEGTAFVSGSAVTQPEGFMTNGDVSEDNSGSAATIADTDGQADGLITLQHNLKEAYARNATWVLNRKSIGAVRKMKDNQKNYIWQPGNLATGIPNAILGDPYIEATDMADEAANAFPVAYGDFRRAYTIVDRINLSVLRDEFTQATSGNVRFVARRRVGGSVVLAEAIRKLKCSA